MLDFDVSTFAGGEHVLHKSVECRGDAADFRSIVERSIAFVIAYSGTLGRGDLAGAYALTDTSLQRRMAFEQFEELHKQAEIEFDGPALEYQIERFVYVLADGAARQDKKDKGWQKDIPPESRRSRIIGFWIRDQAIRSGCRGRLWIVEENAEYRLADFDFYGD